MVRGSSHSAPADFKHPPPELSRGLEGPVGLLLRMAAALAVVALAGCAATKQEVSQNLGHRFIGKNVDTLVSEFGPPANTFRMNSGETAYVWQLSAVAYIDTNNSGGTAKTKPRDDVTRTAWSKADHNAHRPRGIGLRHCHP
jgi:hypothetical protein